MLGAPEVLLKFNIPEWARAPVKHAFDRHREEGRFLHLTMEGLHNITIVPSAVELLRQHNESGRGFASWKETFEHAEDNARWAGEELEAGFPLLHSHSTIALWGILEVFVEDVAIAWLENKPDAWSQQSIRELKVPLGIGEWQALQPEQRAQVAVAELCRSLKVDLKSGAGRLEPLLGALGIVVPVERNLRNAIWELSQVRHVLVHRGARVDGKLKAACPWLPWAIGDRLNLSHNLFAWYFEATEQYIDRVWGAMLVALGIKTADEVSEDDLRLRPEQEVRCDDAG